MLFTPLSGSLFIQSYLLPFPTHKSPEILPLSWVQVPMCWILHPTVHHSSPAALPKCASSVLFPRSKLHLQWVYNKVPRIAC